MPGAVENQNNESQNSREAQRKLALERKMAKPNAPLIQQAKVLWEVIRQKKTADDVRKVKMDKLYKLIKGKVKEVLFKHDASRIIQSAVKHGNQEQRDGIAKELIGCYAELSKSNYGRFIVIKILAYCNKYRSAVIEDFYGKIRKVIKHKEASQVLEEAFNQYANSKQRAYLLQEFYGPEYALFKGSECPLATESVKANPAKVQSILKHMRGIIESVVDKAEAAVGPLSIIHKVILEYVTYAPHADIVSLIDTLKDILVHIVHTRDGAKVFQICMAHASPKQRKLIIRTLKGFVNKISIEQYAHAALISIFDCVDDTVLINKSIIQEMIADVSSASDTPSFAEVVRNRYGSHVVHFLLTGRNRKTQHAYVINELEETDEIKKETSRKDTALRMKELLSAIKLPLLNQCIETCDEILRSANSGSILIDLLSKANLQNDESEEIRNLVQKLIERISKVTVDFNIESFDKEVEEELVHKSENVESSDSESEEEEEEEEENSDEEEDEEKSDEKEKEDSESEAESEAKSEAKKSQPAGSNENVILKMKKEAYVAKLKEEGIDLSIPVLKLNTAANTLKEIIGGHNPANRPVPFGLEIATLISENLSSEQVNFLIEKCCSEPFKYAKLSFFFVVIAEIGGKEICKSLLNNGKGTLSKVDYNKFMKIVEKAEQDTDLESNEIPKKKRKNNNSNSDKKRRAVIKMFLDIVKP